MLFFLQCISALPANTASETQPWGGNKDTSLRHERLEIEHLRASTDSTVTWVARIAEILRGPNDLPPSLLTVAALQHRRPGAAGASRAPKPTLDECRGHTLQGC